MLWCVLSVFVCLSVRLCSHLWICGWPRDCSRGPMEDSWSSDPLPPPPRPPPYPQQQTTPTTATAEDRRRHRSCNIRVTWCDRKESKQCQVFMWYVINKSGKRLKESSWTQKVYTVLLQSTHNTWCKGIIVTNEDLLFFRILRWGGGQRQKYQWRPM